MMEDKKSKCNFSFGGDEEDIEAWWACIGRRGYCGDPHYEN